MRAALEELLREAARDGVTIDDGPAKAPGFVRRLRGGGAARPQLLEAVEPLMATLRSGDDGLFGGTVTFDTDAFRILSSPALGGSRGASPGSAAVSTPPPTSPAAAAVSAATHVFSEQMDMMRGRIAVESAALRATHCRRSGKNPLHGRLLNDLPPLSSHHTPGTPAASTPNPSRRGSTTPAAPAGAPSRLLPPLHSGGQRVEEPSSGRSASHAAHATARQELLAALAEAGQAPPSWALTGTTSAALTKPRSEPSIAGGGEKREGPSAIEAFDARVMRAFAAVERREAEDNAAASQRRLGTIPLEDTVQGDGLFLQGDAHANERARAVLLQQRPLLLGQRPGALPRLSVTGDAASNDSSTDDDRSADLLADTAAGVGSRAPSSVHAQLQLRHRERVRLQKSYGDDVRVKLDALEHRAEAQALAQEALAAALARVEPPMGPGPDPTPAGPASLGALQEADAPTPHHEAQPQAVAADDDFIGGSAGSSAGAGVFAPAAVPANITQERLAVNKYVLRRTRAVVTVQSWWRGLLAQRTLRDRVTAKDVDVEARVAEEAVAMPPPHGPPDEGDVEAEIAQLEAVLAEQQRQLDAVALDMAAEDAAEEQAEAAAVIQRVYRRHRSDRREGAVLCLQRTGRDFLRAQSRQGNQK